MGCDFCEQLDLDDCVSIVPFNQCLRVERGTDMTFEAILTDARDEPFDISLDQVVFTVRDYEGGTKKIQKTNLAGSHLDGPNGRTSFDIADTDITDTQTTDRLYWVYEVRRIQPSGLESVHVKGAFIVEPQVGD